MLIRQRIYNGLIGAFLVGLVVGLGGCPQKTPTEKLLVLCESLEADYIVEIRELIQAGADVNVKNKYGETPLYIAAQKGHVEVVAALLMSGANVDAADVNGMTPLWWAAKDGHDEVVKLLLKAGADVNAGPSDGYTPLRAAEKGGHSEVVELLKEHRAK